MRVSRDKLGRLLPTGECYCGCGEDMKEPTSFFLPGHDKVAESAVINLEYGSVAEFMVKYGFGPGGRNAREELDAFRRKGGTRR